MLHKILGSIDTPEKFEAKRITLATHDDAIASRELAAEFGISADAKGDHLVLRVPDGEAFVPRIFSTLSVGVTSVNVRRPSLDDVLAHAEVDLRDGRTPEAFGDVDEESELDTPSFDERHRLEGITASGVLTGERLDDTGELRPVEVEQGPRQQLGDPAAAGLDATVERVLAFGASARVELIGPDGRMSALRQVLTPRNFDRVQPGMTADQVRRLLGRLPCVHAPRPLPTRQPSRAAAAWRACSCAAGRWRRWRPTPR